MVGVRVIPTIPTGLPVPFARYGFDGVGVRVGPETPQGYPCQSLETPFFLVVQKDIRAGGSVVSVDSSHVKPFFFQVHWSHVYNM